MSQVRWSRIAVAALLIPREQVTSRQSAWKASPPTSTVRWQDTVAVCSWLLPSTQGGANSSSAQRYPSTPAADQRLQEHPETSTPNPAGLAAHPVSSARPYSPTSAEPSPVPAAVEAPSPPPSDKRRRSPLLSGEYWGYLLLSYVFYWVAYAAVAFLLLLWFELMGFSALSKWWINWALCIGRVSSTVVACVMACVWYVFIKDENR